MKHYAKGYTQGVFDMFHIGHLKLINNAKARCKKLVVGVNADALVERYKHKLPVVGEQDRREIVRNIRAVDEVVIAQTLDKLEMHACVGFDAIFIGSDWKGDPRWAQTERDLGAIGVDVVYLPYTDGVSSTEFRCVGDQKVEG